MFSKKLETLGRIVMPNLDKVALTGGIAGGVIGLATGNPEGAIIAAGVGSAFNLAARSGRGLAREVWNRTHPED